MRRQPSNARRSRPAASNCTCHVCCTLLQPVAACCSVYCSVLQGGAPTARRVEPCVTCLVHMCVCVYMYVRSMSHPYVRGAVCCSVLQRWLLDVSTRRKVRAWCHVPVRVMMSQPANTCCCVLQCVAACVWKRTRNCCSVMCVTHSCVAECVALCCSIISVTHSYVWHVLTHAVKARQTYEWVSLWVIFRKRAL